MPCSSRVGLRCPNCGSAKVYAVALFPTDDGDTVRRRRCSSCNLRWYSIQPPEEVVPSTYAVSFYYPGGDVIGQFARVTPQAPEVVA